MVFAPANLERPLLRALKPDLWARCGSPGCRKLMYAREFENNLKVCSTCGHHARLSARERIEQLVDAGSFVERDKHLVSADPLQFVAAGEAYADKLRQARRKTGESEAAISGTASLMGCPVELVVLDFGFMGASMGSVVGEKIARAAARAARKRSALITVNSSGGARMHEGIFSLLQMAKTVSSLARLANLRVPHVSVLADPTLGGVSASYAGIGDVLLVEQDALVGFAGPRVIQQTTRERLPADAQRASFLLAHGMVDMVVKRSELRDTIGRLVQFYAAARVQRAAWLRAAKRQS